jgi:phage baseplate assembly protein W
VKIQIKSLEPENLTVNSLKKDYLYKDLDLDIKPEVYLNRQLNKKDPQKDIAAIYDIEAVKNSIVTALTTSPGDKILSPTYGIDLRRHLFEVIDVFLYDVIQDEIETFLPIMEPRVEIVNVKVTGNPDNNEVFIELQINVPSLNVYGLSIKSELNSTGYSIV